MTRISRGDLLVSNGATGVIHHHDRLGVFIESILTRGYKGSDGVDIFVEAGDIAMDTQGRMYVCLEGLVASDPFQWGGPQVEWFDNNANSLGRFDNNVFKSGFPERLLPEGIVALADGTFLVLAERTATSTSTKTMRLIHLSSTGSEITRWSLVSGTAINFPRLDISCDQRTVYYTQHFGLTPAIRRFDIVTGTQLPDFAATTGVGFFNDLIVLPNDGGVLAIDRQTGVGSIMRRYNIDGSIMWSQVLSRSALPGAPEEAMALASDRRTFWTDLVLSSGPDQQRVGHWNLSDGSFIESFIKNDFPELDYTPAMHIYFNKCSSGFVPVSTVVGAN